VRWWEATPLFLVRKIIPQIWTTHHPILETLYNHNQNRRRPRWSRPSSKEAFHRCYHTYPPAPTLLFFSSDWLSWRAARDVHALAALRCYRARGVCVVSVETFKFFLLALDFQETVISLHITTTSGRMNARVEVNRTKDGEMEVHPFGECSLDYFGVKTKDDMRVSARYEVGRGLLLIPSTNDNVTLIYHFPPVWILINWQSILLEHAKECPFRFIDSDLRQEFHDEEPQQKVRIGVAVVIEDEEERVLITRRASSMRTCRWDHVHYMNAFRGSKFDQFPWAGSCQEVITFSCL
jgi:hypothetical protein